MITRTTLTIALIAIAAGCAPHAANAQPAPASLRIVHGQDIALSGGQTAMDGVRLLRPVIETGRVNPTLETQSRAEPLVFLDGARVALRTLEGIDREEVDTIEYIVPRTAEMRYGSDARGGAIVVTTRRGS